MAHIKDIRFAHVGRNDGCLCDRCGQYIQNIVTVVYTDGLSLNYGQDCFDKLWKGAKLTAYGQKLFREAIKKAKDHQTEYQKWISGEITPDTDQSWQYHQNTNTYGSPSYWYGRPWEEYKEWMINEWWPERFKEDAERIKRFEKCNFDRDGVEA